MCFKKFLAFISALIMVLAGCLSCAQAKVLSKEDMVAYLLYCGFPEESLDCMDLKSVKELYNSLSGKRIVPLGTETKTLSELSPSEAELVGALALKEDSCKSNTRGVIPSSDMTFTITKIANTTYDSRKRLDKIKEIYVYVNYIWASGKPFWTWTDGITVNWDSSVFTFKSGSFVAKDYKRTLNTGGWILTSIYSNPASLNVGGLGYYTKLTYSSATLGQSFGALQHKGTASFTLLPTRKPMYIKSGAQVTSINANYLHNMNPGVFSINFSYSGLGVSATLYGLQDSVAVSTNVYYSY